MQYRGLLSRQRVCPAAGTWKGNRASVDGRSDGWRGNGSMDTRGSNDSLQDIGRERIQNKRVLPPPLQIHSTSSHHRLRCSSDRDPQSAWVSHELQVVPNNVRVFIHTSLLCLASQILAPSRSTNRKLQYISRLCGVPGDSRTSEMFYPRGSSNSNGMPMKPRSVCGVD
jgi:hypothetical protein